MTNNIYRKDDLLKLFFGLLLKEMRLTTGSEQLGTKGLGNKGSKKGKGGKK